MSSGLLQNTRLSSKGQRARAAMLGTEFTVEETGDGTLLRPASRFPDTPLEGVSGCLRSKGEPKTNAQMTASIGREVKHRHDRGRY